MNTSQLSGGVFFFFHYHRVGVATASWCCTDVEQQTSDLQEAAFPTESGARQDSVLFCISGLERYWLWLFKITKQKTESTVNHNSAATDKLLELKYRRRLQTCGMFPNKLLQQFFYNVTSAHLNSPNVNFLSSHVILESMFFSCPVFWAYFRTDVG